MYIFTFEPGDGISYRIIFGQLPGPNRFVPVYTIFGIAEGSSDPGSWYAFDTRDVSFNTFARHIHVEGAVPATTATGYRVYRALLGWPDSEDAAADCPPWRFDWREQLPLPGL